MSYIVAFVNFKESSKSLYPFDCTRDDLVPGDKVIVRTKDQRLSVAFVNKLEYLGWNCRAEILCKLSERSQNTDGDYIIPKDAPYKKGYAGYWNTVIEHLAQMTGHESVHVGELSALRELALVSMTGK